MFGAVEDDDLEFNPAAGSKLASLFNLEDASGKGNASLTYTAPKQPKTHNPNDNGISPSKRTVSNSSSSSNKLTLVIVKAVTSFKLEDGNYNHLGKLGLALLGNSTSKIFQLLLYKGKQQQITSARISPFFQFTVQPNLYASFYDDRMQNWSIMFENKDDAIDFTTQVAVARYRVSKSKEESIICQELLPGLGPSFQEGETVKLQLAAVPFIEDSVQAVDIRQSMIKCDLNHCLTNSGWAAGLIGSASGALRLILVPVLTHLPWLSSKRNEPLLIEVSINTINEVKVKKSEELIPNEVNALKKSGSASGIDSAVDSGAEDSSVRARGASIKEALSSSPRSVKASIISRMARMGQATLPLKGAIACNPSDSEETEEDSGKKDCIKAPLKARTGKARTGLPSQRQQVSPHLTSSKPSPDSSSVSPATVTVVQAPLPWNPHQQNLMQRTGSDGSVMQIVTPEGQIVSLGSQQQFPLVAAQSSMMSPNDPTPHISMFLSEARMHNTEMRMHFGKFSDKMDHLMAKVDTLNTSSGGPGTVGGLEPNVLLSSIEKLVRDNQSLQAEVADKSKRLDEQNERIFSLLHTNSKFLEQSSNLFEQKQNHEEQQQKQEQLQKQLEQQLLLIQQMREEKVSLCNQLVGLQNQLATVQELMQALQKSNIDLNQELEATRSRLQEKEKCLQGVEQTEHHSGREDELLSLKEALDEQKTLNLKLKEQIASDRAKFDSEINVCSDKIRNMEKEHLAEVSVVKEEVNKQLANQYKSSLSALEIECETLKKKLGEPFKQADGSSLEHLIPDVKLLLNTLYRGLNQQFVVGSTYEGGQIRAAIGSIVKEEALQFVDKMEKLQSMQRSSSEPKKDMTNLEPELSEPKGPDELYKQFKSSATDSQQHRPAESFSTIKPSSSEKLSKISENVTESLTAGAQLSLDPSTVGNEEKCDVGNLERPSIETKEHDSSVEKLWKPLPPPPPLFPDEDDSDEW